MSNDPLVRKLRKAARQRLTSAEILLNHHQFLDSTYLAGYGVECALKALLFARTPQSRQSHVREQVFRGKSGHDLENLKARLRKQSVNIPPDVMQSFRTVGTWTTDLRYEVGSGSGDDANEFFDAAKAIVDWVEDQI